MRLWRSKVTEREKQKKVHLSGSFWTWEENIERKLPINLNKTFKPFPNKTWFLRVCSTNLF